MAGSTKTAGPRSNVNVHSQVGELLSTDPILRARDEFVNINLNSERSLDRERHGAAERYLPTRGPMIKLLWPPLTYLTMDGGRTKSELSKQKQLKGHSNGPPSEIPRSGASNFQRPWKFSPVVSA